MKRTSNNYGVLKYPNEFNATKALSSVLGNKGINSCYIPKGKSHITRYQELQNFKQAWKGIIIDDSEKMKILILSL